MQIVEEGELRTTCKLHQRKLYGFLQQSRHASYGSFGIKALVEGSVKVSEDAKRLVHVPIIADVGVG